MLENEHGDTSVLTKLFEHNMWANLKLLDFCEGLSEEHLAAGAVGGFGSIRDTLRHIIGAEVSYVSRVNGKLPAKPLSPDQYPEFGVMKDAARWTGEELLKLARSAREETVVRQHPPRQLIEYKLSSLIVQAINHSTEHRAQIATVITQLGMEPPDMSGWNYMDEIGELKEVGEEAG